MAAPITVVALDAVGTVIRSRLVPPNRVFVASRARWIAETPAGALPSVGDRAVLAFLIGHRASGIWYPDT